VLAYPLPQKGKASPIRELALFLGSTFIARLELFVDFTGHYYITQKVRHNGKNYLHLGADGVQVLIFFDTI
jgi:hypothetical protein